MIFEIVKIAIHVGIASLIVGAWAAWNRRAAPAWEEVGGGRITPGKVSAFVIVTIGVAMAGFGATLLFTGIWPVGGGMIAVGAVLATFMAPSLTRWHDVMWDSRGVEGACRLFGPTLGLSRTRIAWPDIVKAGMTATSYWFVEAADGRRIYWSYLYPGHGAFWQQVLTNAHNLDDADLPSIL